MDGCRLPDVRADRSQGRTEVSGLVQHELPVARRETEDRQFWIGQQVGAPIVTAIALLPGPVNGPQRTCRTGFVKSKMFTSSPTR